MAQQLGQIERMDRPKRFLPQQVAELILIILDSHRRDVTVVFCDLRGFTAFSETSEPEEVMNILREYHAAVGAIIGGGPCGCSAMPRPRSKTLRSRSKMRERWAMLPR